MKLLALIFITISTTLSLSNYCRMKVVPNPAKGTKTCSGEFWDKYVDVFGYKIYATKLVSDCDLKTVAYTTYGLIDNNYDGKIDNPDMMKAQFSIQNKYIVYTTMDERKTVEDQMRAKGYADCMGHIDGVGISVIKDSEVNGNVYFQEEAFHSLADYGYAKQYPSVFGIDEKDQASSEMMVAMDAARGGKFEKTPSKYPAGAWYTYTEQSCTRGCQASEYVWHLASTYYNICTTYPKYCAAMAKVEWTPITREDLKTTDKLGYAFISKSEYKIPTQVPKEYNCADTAQSYCTESGKTPQGSFGFSNLISIFNLLLFILVLFQS